MDGIADGQPGQRNGHDRIGVATVDRSLFDGKTWNVEPEPVIDVGDSGDGIYYMWYEGYGGGTARIEAYGSYLKGGKSQVGLATLEADYFYVDPLKFK